MARPTITWLGGTACTPRALRARVSTITMRVNGVTMTSSDGATDITVSTRMMTMLLDGLSPVLRLMSSVLSPGSAVVGGVTGAGGVGGVGRGRRLGRGSASAGRRRLGRRRRCRATRGEGRAQAEHQEHRRQEGGGPPGSARARVRWATAASRAGSAGGWTARRDPTGCMGCLAAFAAVGGSGPGGPPFTLVRTVISRRASTKLIRGGRPGGSAASGATDRER